MKEEWSKVNLYSDENRPKISRIIEIEYELTEAVMKGHKSYMGDEYREKRMEMYRLRREVLDSGK